MTSKLSLYSTTPASNNSAAPDGWPEGMLPSDVNNSAREMMARVREWYQDAEWVDHGHSIQSSTASTVVVSGDQTAIYVAGRAVRVNQSSSQVGRVTSSTYAAPNTTINVEGFTVSGPTQLEVGIVSSADSLPGFKISKATTGYQKLPSGLVLQWGTTTTTSNGSATVTLPVTHASATASVAATIYGVDGVGNGIATLNITTSNFQLSTYASASGSGKALTVKWQSVGY